MVLIKYLKKNIFLFFIYLYPFFTNVVLFDFIFLIFDIYNYPPQLKIPLIAVSFHFKPG
jgi:hypothetical protein